jgi:hypothetical protein
VTQVSYHIRTLRGTPVYICETLQRAQEEKRKAEQRVGCKMKLVKITQTEEEVDA